MNDQLTFDDLRAYQAGRLSGPARHRVERLLLEDPFYADALAGLEAMQQTATPTAEQLASLRDALQERIHASATKKRLWPIWIATTTAAILFMLAMAIYFIFFLNRQPAKPKPVHTPKSTVGYKDRPIRFTEKSNDLWYVWCDSYRINTNTSCQKPKNRGTRNTAA